MSTKCNMMEYNYEICQRFDERVFYNGIEDLANMFMKDWYTGNERKLDDKFTSLCVVLSNLYEGNLRGNMIAYHRGSQHYTFGQKYITRSITLPQIDRLIGSGLAKGVDAIINHRLPRIYPSDDLVDMFSGLGNRTGLDFSRLLELRGKSSPDIKKYDLILPIKMSDFLERKEQNLFSYCSYIDYQVIQYVCNNYTTGGSRYYNKYIGNSYPYPLTCTLRIDIDGKCQKVFNSTVFEGGRQFGGIHQRMPKSERKNITINGSNTVELDFVSLHPTLMYHQQGIEFEGDMYAAVYGQPELKGLVKLLFFTVINAKTLVKAKKAFNYEVYYKDTFSDDSKGLKKQMESKGLTFDLMLDRLLKVHYKIKDKICSGEGIRLQNTDGNITNEVLSTLTSMDIPALNVYDSFIVPQQHAVTLYDTMQEQYQLATNYSIGIK